MKEVSPEYKKWVSGLSPLQIEVEKGKLMKAIARTNIDHMIPVWQRAIDYLENTLAHYPVSAD